MIAALIALTLFGVAALGSLSLAAFFGGAGYPMEVFSHFRPHYCAGGLIFGASLLVLKRPQAALVPATIAIINCAALFTPLLNPASSAVRADGQRIRVLWANLEYSPAALAAFAKLAAETDADIIALTELPAGDPYAASIALPFLPGVVAPTDISIFAVALQGREAFAGGGDVPGARPPWRSAAQWAQTPSGLRIVALHPTPPIDADALWARDELIRAAGQAATMTPTSLLVGDFNATPWSRVMIDLKATGLKRVDCGAPWTSTWRSRRPLAGLPIDSAYVCSGIRAASCRVGPDIGSDHFPLIIDLELP